MAWLTNFDNRIKFSIDHTKIDEDLTHFPVTLSLSSTFCSEVFSDLLSDTNRFKIAFTKDDGVTELYGEIEQFDCVNSKAVYHISKNDWIIASGTNTNFYMYYDSSHVDNTNYIGDIGSTPGEHVWDSDFEAVYHLNGSYNGTSGEVKDSTSNTHNLTGGDMSSNTPSKVELLSGNYAQEFTPHQDITGIIRDPLNETELSIEALIKPKSFDTHNTILCTTSNDAGGYWGVAFKCDGGTLQFRVYDDSAVGSYTVSTDTLYYIAGTVEPTCSRLYVDGDVKSTNSNPGKVDGRCRSQWQIGYRGTTYPRGFDGIIDEVRFSWAVRNEAWIKATYDSLFGNLVTKVESGVNAIFFGFNF